MTDQNGLYTGNWYIKDDDDDQKVSPIILKHNGLANFYFKFSRESTIEGAYGHIYMSSTLQSKDTKNNKIEISLLVNSSVNYSIDLNQGVIQMFGVRSDLIRMQDISTVDMGQTIEENIQLLLYNFSYFTYTTYPYRLFGTSQYHLSFSSDCLFGVGKYNMKQQQDLKLFIFYCQFYFTCIFFYSLNRYILEINWLLILLNGSIWIPQIIQTYHMRSRKGPDLSYAIILTISHSFLPLYSRLCPNNIFEREPEYFFGFLYAGYMIIQVGIIYLQKVLGPRFIVPKRFRQQINTHNYFVKIKKSQQNDHNSTQEISENENQDLEIQEECVICMNPLMYEVSQDRNQSMIGNQSQQKLSKVFMRTPCNHKYHVQCLTKWMDIRLECPSCRQQIPIIEED
eukprot:403373792